MAMTLPLSPSSEHPPSPTTGSGAGSGSAASSGSTTAANSSNNTNNNNNNANDSSASASATPTLSSSSTGASSSSSSLTPTSSTGGGAATAAAAGSGGGGAAAAAAAMKRKPSRRANTAERRATHNAVERQRRETLNGRFLDLAALLPNLSQIRRPSKSSIVNSSIAHIHASRRHRLLASTQLRSLKLESDALRRELNEWRDRAGIPRVEEPVRGEAFGMVLGGGVGDGGCGGCWGGGGGGGGLWGWGGGGLSAAPRRRRVYGCGGGDRGDGLSDASDAFACCYAGSGSGARCPAAAATTDGSCSCCVVRPPRTPASFGRSGRPPRSRYPAQVGREREQRVWEPVRA
ncbi:hypothetical protein GALMADRAFT_925642 [Galerina marginata CBS 339.88]|uniref:BHLH domain-containing protein n=1 Tax=Galerina marginata (strain CBS 339.88) TaxID=685588 RepID=A0A067SR14_GALM3|nr:hypothetical protein GALMADRAFT_925642 [Galerina marginata CBS 339.88]